MFCYTKNVVNRNYKGRLTLSIFLGFLRSVFFISIALYIYYFSRRKKHDVIFQMWLMIIVGMISSLAIQLINVSIGNSKWESIQISFFLLTAIVFYSIWKLLIEFRLRKRQNKS